MQSTGIRAYSNNLPAQGRSSAASAAGDVAATTAVQSRQGEQQEPTDSARFTARAARLARLNQEFDLADPDFHISQSFLTRMADLALILRSEASVLIERLPHVENLEPRTESMQVLEQFLSDLARQLEPDNQRAHLVSVLRDSKVILEHMEISQSRAHDAEIGTTLAALGLHLTSEDAPRLSQKQLRLIEDTRTALVVAYKLNPLNHNSNQLNAYARISGNLV